MKKFWISLILVTIAYTGYWAYGQYQSIFKANVNAQGAAEVYVEIPTGTNYESLLEILKEGNILIDFESFEWLAEFRNLPKHVYAGRYKLASGTSNYKLINILRSGAQEPVKFVLQSTRTREVIASRVSKQIEGDSASISRLLYNRDKLREHGLGPDTWMTVFIPNTYELYWNTSAEQFLERMVKEHKRFWNEERMAKANKLNLTTEEVSTLASIVQQETVMEDEQATIAGVYLNRIRLGMKLDADPTLIFAVGDFSITRVLNEHKEIDSPYNTYIYAGLPPGPICIPTISNIDAVLKDERHKYIYFCAKEDFSGYHNFARTLGQHQVNAAKFRRELNRRRIWN